MTSRISLVLLILLAACSNRLPKKNMETTYRLVAEISDDLKELKKSAERSKAELEIDTETGHFKGRYKSHDFTGKYTVEHVSAGFVKGFFYRVKIEELNRPESRNEEEEAFFEHLSAARRLYFAPDKLNQPAYVTLEISRPDNDTKLVFVKINRKS